MVLPVREKKSGGTAVKENVCVDCKYYESCGKPERYMKCMGYEEKERQQAAGEHAVDVQDG